VVVGAPPVCFTCGGKGQKMTEKEIICPECKWLRPLVPGYNVDCRAFQWASDGVAMSKLRSISSLQKVARTVSDKVGRRWIETTFDAIQLGENQLPEIYGQAVLAARILAVEHMPDIYVSGNPAWDATTYGSDTNSFVVIGSALLMNFKAEELLFLFAREMGHCRAGHSLWKTVLHFLVGSQSTKVEGKSGGILRHLNLTALVTDAVELPLLAWARHSEITADRAGMLALGNEQEVRKVLLAWSLKSPALYDKINIEAWIQQQSTEGDDAMTRVSEMVTSPVPYIARRLKLMADFAGSNELRQSRAIIENSLKQAGIVKNDPKPIAATEAKAETEKKVTADTNQAKAETQSKPQSDVIKIACTSCKTAMRIPLTAFGDKESLNVRCPNKDCGKVLAIKRKPAPPPTMSIAE
jgi:Zn-dependent protease with chaperone function